MNSLMSFWFYNLVKVNIQVAKEAKLFWLFSSPPCQLLTETRKLADTSRRKRFWQLQIYIIFSPEATIKTEIKKKKRNFKENQSAISRYQIQN